MPDVLKDAHARAHEYNNVQKKNFDATRCEFHWLFIDEHEKILKKFIEDIAVIKTYIKVSTGVIIALIALLGILMAFIK